tara:strand:- start:514 stop:729 length:216 start_codon:yes stop_codon:yes gene_type:complete
MAFKMNSPFQSKRKKEEKRNIKKFKKNTEVIKNSSGKNVTVDKSTLDKARKADIENLKNKSNEELESMRNK